jgi:hypothetical protein
MGQPKDGKGKPAAAQALQLPLHGRGVEVFSLSSATSPGGGNLFVGTDFPWLERIKP